MCTANLFFGGFFLVPFSIMIDEPSVFSWHHLLLGFSICFIFLLYITINQTWVQGEKLSC
jgi:hypothetical protein